MQGTQGNAAGLAMVMLAVGASSVTACTVEDDEGTAVARVSGLTAPSSLSATPMGTGVHLTWRDNSAEETEFEVERKEGTSAPFAKIASVLFDVLQHHDTSVAASRSYTYRVRGVASSGAKSRYSNEVTVAAPATATGTPSPSGAGTSSPGGTTASSVGWDGGPVSFAKHIVPLFQRSCGAGNTSCHAPNAYAATSDRACRGWLSLEDAPLGSTYDGKATGCPDRSLHARLTELDAWQEPGGATRRYVKAGDPAGSYLFNKIAGGPYGDDRPGVTSLPMPTTGTLSAADIAMMKKWIESGAAAN